MKKNAGRPAGTRNSEHAIVATMPAACPKCKSTERESVRIVRERYMPGMAPNGQPRTHIIWRRVRCMNCGQYFVEQEHQNRLRSFESATQQPDEEKTIENLDSFSESSIVRS